MGAGGVDDRDLHLAGGDQLLELAGDDAIEAAGPDTVVWRGKTWREWFKIVYNEDFIS